MKANHKSKKVGWKSINLRIIFIAVIVSAVLFFGVGLFLYQAYAQFSYNIDKPIIRDVSSSVVYLPTKAENGTGAPSLLVEMPTLEIHIANNGALLLRGARVMSVSLDTISVAMTWDSANFVWEVQIDKFFTKILTSEGKKGTLEDIQVGDILTITGKLIRGEAGPTISAQFVREQ